MSPGFPLLILRLVAEDLTVCIRLRLEGESPKGRARDSSGRERDFSGWIGLVAAIDHLLASAGEPDGASGRTEA